MQNMNYQLTDSLCQATGGISQELPGLHDGHFHRTKVINLFCIFNHFETTHQDLNNTEFCIHLWVSDLFQHTLEAQY